MRIFHKILFVDGRAVSVEGLGEDNCCGSYVPSGVVDPYVLMREKCEFWNKWVKSYEIEHPNMFGIWAGVDLASRGGVHPKLINHEYVGKIIPRGQENEGSLLIL